MPQHPHGPRPPRRVSGIWIRPAGWGDWRGGRSPTGPSRAPRRRGASAWLASVWSPTLPPRAPGTGRQVTEKVAYYVIPATRAGRPRTGAAAAGAVRPRSLVISRAGTVKRALKSWGSAGRGWGDSGRASGGFGRGERWWIRLCFPPVAFCTRPAGTGVVGVGSGKPEWYGLRRQLTFSAGPLEPGPVARGDRVQAGSTRTLLAFFPR